MEEKLKVLCINEILKDNGVELNNMTANDIIEYLEINDTITFENIEELVKNWIEDTKINYPEYIK